MVSCLLPIQKKIQEQETLCSFFFSTPEERLLSVTFLPARFRNRYHLDQLKFVPKRQKQKMCCSISVSVASIWISVISKWFRSFPTGYCAVSTQLWLSSTCEQKEMVGQIAGLLNHQFYPCFRTKLSVPHFPVVAFWGDDSWTATTDLWSHWDTCRRKLFPPCEHFSFELSTIRRLNERNGSPYEISLEPPAD